MTYSLGITGTRADAKPSQPTNVTLSDEYGQRGGRGRAARTGQQILCRNPDGSQGYYVIDAERTIPGVQTVLRAVGP